MVSKLNHIKMVVQIRIQKRHLLEKRANVSEQKTISIKKRCLCECRALLGVGTSPINIIFFLSMCKSKRLILCQSTNLFVSKPKYQLNQKIRPKKNEEESPSLGHVFQLYKIDVGLRYVLRMNACI